jgi:hypothetical protein
MGHEEARQVLVLANICGPCIPTEVDKAVTRAAAADGGRAGPGPAGGLPPGGSRRAPGGIE